MNVPNHQPVLKGLLLHEHLLTRDFQGDQHFFRKDGSVGAYSAMPDSAPAAATQLVPHEEAPAFSDVASTATAAATSPLTTFSPTTPRPMSLPYKKSSGEKSSGEAKVVPTTDSLTTQVTLHSRGSGNDNNQAASLLSQKGRSESLSAIPAEPTLAPSSVRMEKVEFRETALKDKTNPDHLLSHKTTSSKEEFTTRTSTTVITTTTITTMQTTGKQCS